MAWETDGLKDFDSTKPFSPPLLSLYLSSIPYSLSLQQNKTLAMAKDRNESIAGEGGGDLSGGAAATSRRDRRPKSKRKKDESGDDDSTDSGGDKPRSNKKKKSSRSFKRGSRKRRRSDSDDESDSSSSDSYEESDESTGGTDSDASDSGSDGSEARRRRRKKERRRREREREREHKRERRRKEKEKKRKRKREKEKEKKKKKKDKKGSSREKARAMQGAVTNSWGKYGIIRETDMWNKRPEFTAWLAEVKKVNLESLANWEEKQMFKDFMEDHNTATFPSKKYYDLDTYHRRKLEKEVKKGLKDVTKTERTIFNDEEQRRQELLRERERHKEGQVEALKQSMQSGMAQAMKEQSRLREEMAYQYRIGNFEAAALIQRRLDPDVAM